MQKLTVALDWTPNINHIGFFVAQAKGFYRDLNLEVTITNPAADNYQITPAKKLELGEADFALCPTESVISYRTKSKAFPLIAIATLLQNDLSAIAVLNNQGIQSPKDLDGKSYSSYRARYEDGIVKEMIKNDGGKGDLNISYPEKLGIWETLIKGESDSTWIFLNWEGVEAAQSDYQLNYFKLEDYQIPYSYSPVIAANESKIKENLDDYKHFLEATKKGYLFCHENDAEAIHILEEFVPENDKGIDLSMALAMSSPHFGNAQDWGIIKEEKIERFLNWIKEKGLETSDITVADIATNACFA